MSGIVSAVSKFFSKLPFTAPWKVTGVASSVEFADYLPKATEYRVHSPQSQPLRPSVPAALPDRVYNIKYYDRDARREHMLVGGTNRKEIVQYDADLSAETQGPDGLPPTPGNGFKWGGRKKLLDYENNGYT